MTETIDTARIAEILGYSRRHVTSRIVTRPDFPKPRIAISRIRSRWRWAPRDLTAWMLGVTPMPLLLGFNQYSTTDAAVRVLRSKLQGAQRRSRKRGRECPLTIEQLKDLHAQQRGRCAVSGIPMPTDVDAGDPFAPSLDRIDSTRGYEPGNVRLVCHAINLMMNKWGDRVFHEFVEALRRADR